MALGRKFIAIELMPTRLELVVRDGTSQRDAVRCPIQTSGEAAQWVSDIRHLVPELQRIVGELDVRGWPAYVTYRSPSQAVDIDSSIVRSHYNACEAAKLSCFDSLPYAPLVAVSEAAIIGRDHSGTDRRTHIVAAVDRDDAVGAIVDLIESAGLTFRTATPVDAALMYRIGRECLKASDAGQCVLYIGQVSSLLFINGAGTIRFARRIGIGVESLVSALTRPIHTDANGSTVTLSAEEARELLYRAGLPDREDVLDASRGLRGCHINPVLQPILQRFVVELRQSLRFGLSEGEVETVQILTKGPGCIVPNLVSTFAEEFGIEMRIDEHYRCFDPNAPGAPGSELDDVMADRSVLETLNLQPKDRAVAGQARRLTRWLWTGAAAAIMLIALDAMRYHHELENLEREAASIATHIEQQEQLRETKGRLAKAIAARDELHSIIESHMSHRAPYRAMLHELSLLTPDSIRFTHLQFRVTESGLQGTFQGIAHRGDDTQTVNLRAFVDQLRQSPLFESVVLGDVQIIHENDSTSERFDVTVNPTYLPHDVGHALAREAGDLQEIRP